MRAVLLLALALSVSAASGAASSCGAGTLYLTLDTGSMVSAEKIAAVLMRHHIRATFFLANEPTARGDHALDDSWGDYWRARVAEGHHFGSHTWRHGSLRSDSPDGRITDLLPSGQKVFLDEPEFCAELNQVDKRFTALTGQSLQPLWRAPGGRTTALALQWAPRCGYTRHVGWANAGFLGDELPSEKFPNTVLLQRALHNIKSSDILMMHLGIRSRHDPFADVFEDLITGLQSKGFCFATLP
jgi:peptidoglycan/xylan/chitin deacetylase (PgdA/CDA1 family)